jgi:hypothetical protein
MRTLKALAAAIRCGDWFEAQALIIGAYLTARGVSHGREAQR